jgi:hypothetical protein
MFFDDLRLGIATAYAALVMWRVLGQGDEWWPYVLVLAIIMGGVRGFERALNDARVRRYVAHFAALDPADAKAKISRMWLSGVRNELSRRLAEQGTVERSDFTERFPFTKGAQRRATTLFWLAIGAAALALAALAFVAHLPGWIGLGCWLVTATFVVVARQARQSSLDMQSALEVSHFGLTEVALSGDRRTLLWTEQLFIVDKPRRHRVELFNAAGKMIPISYRRLGFVRLLQLVLVNGGFRREKSDETASDDEG